MPDTLNEHLEENTAQNTTAQMQEWKDKALRVSAEFDNYKKRQERDRQQFDYFAQRQVILPLLNAVDNLKRFKDQSIQLPNELKEWALGIDLIMKDFEKYFSTIGLQPIDQLQDFDPALHEAVMQVEQEGNSGKVIEVLEPGYTFKNNVLRPAKVSVGS